MRTWKSWHVVLLLIVLVSLAGWGLWSLRTNRTLTVAEQLGRLPQDTETIFYADVAKLRATGLLARLAGSRVNEEPDYQRFVREIEFDYREDMDSLLVGWRQNQMLALVTGRFDWPMIRQYALEHQGYCSNGICEMPSSSAPKRAISFSPISGPVMALTVSEARMAVAQLLSTRRQDQPPPGEPIVWLRMPGQNLQSGTMVPDGVKNFARVLAEADSLILAIHGAGDGAEIRLSAKAKSPEGAQQMLNQLKGFTQVVRDYLAKSGHQPNAADLSGVVTGGEFAVQEGILVGKWPLPRKFLEELTSAGL